MRRVMAIISLLNWCLMAPVGLCADEQASLRRATVSRSGDVVVCHLQTHGLPGEKQLQTMRSGLESSVELSLALVDQSDELLGGNLISLRMGFDLWDEVFSVRGDGRERRFQTLTDLQSYLAELSDLPVAPASLLRTEGNYRVQVGLVVHAIAPEEQARVDDVIAGDQRARREGQDRQEASVSLSHLIRLFYKGGRESALGQELSSRWFTGKELPDATH